MTIRKIVVLGGNGVMGSGSAGVFAAAGFETVLLARTLEKAQAGRDRAIRLLGEGHHASPIRIGTYADDLATEAGTADLVFEALAEDLAIKRDMFARIDGVRDRDAIVATVSSGLSIAAQCDGRSASFRAHFLGMHLFNPPTVITGCELVPHAGTDPGVVATARELLASSLARVVVECADTPAFAGNRIGFKVLNEIAQLAEHHGVAYIDQLFGSHTGRALPPLATIDLVGWDVHKAIVDNLYANTRDEAHACFALPAYMQRGIDHGHLGRKTRDKGGFFRVDGKGKDARSFVVDPATGEYRPLAEAMELPPAFVERMKSAIRAGRPSDAIETMCGSDGRDAELLRGVVLGYVSYGLGRVGEVVRRASDVDRIMAFGFHWAPPSMLVDAIGAKRTVAMLERAELPVPEVVRDAAKTGAPIYEEPVDVARYFTVAA
jgi:3-hydroxyacyl-CoA dehydrogenase